jgi:hypothetical protein
MVGIQRSLPWMVGEPGGADLAGDPVRLDREQRDEVDVHEHRVGILALVRMQSTVRPLAVDDHRHGPGDITCEGGSAGTGRHRVLRWFPHCAPRLPGALASGTSGADGSR